MWKTCVFILLTLLTMCDIIEVRVQKEFGKGIKETKMSKTIYIVRLPSKSPAGAFYTLEDAQDFIKSEAQKDNGTPEFKNGGMFATWGHVDKTGEVNHEFHANIFTCELISKGKV